jgi:hypothetical protein
MKRVASIASLVLSLALPIGCDRPPDRPAAPPDDAARSETPAAAPSPPSADDAALARWTALLPDSLRHRSGACPFECCLYRTWTGTGETPARDAPERTRPIAFRIPAGEPFEADSGFVRITGVSLLAVDARVDAGPTRFEPGDTLVVLDYVGEGYYNVWDGQRVWQVSGFWGAEVGDPRASLIGGDRYAREWWTHVTTQRARTGWIDMDSVPRVRGADACGG